jgi:hypothetical protein
MTNSLTATKRSKNHDLFLVGILLVGLALRLALAWQPVELLIVKTLPDDAYYYFNIARHFASGRGFTFDGLSQTNGFHPLWALLLGGLYALTNGGGDGPIHLALSISALIDTATIGLVYLTLCRITGDDGAARLGAALYAFNPLLVIEAVNGLETALAAFFFALCSYWYLVRVRGKDADWQTCAMQGILGGLMVLARTDSSFLLVVIALDWLWRERRKGLVGLALTLAVAALVVSPWIAWNAYILGGPVQSSGVAIPFVVRQVIFSAGRFSSPLLQYLAAAVYLGFILWDNLWRYARLEIVLLVGGLLAVAIRRLNLEDEAGRRLKSNLGLVAVPLLASLLLLCAHAFGRWFLRGWYYVPAAFSFVLAGGLALAYAREKWAQAGRPLGQLSAAVLAALALAFPWQGLPYWQPGLYIWQADMRLGADWLAENTDPQDRIGAFNAGMLAYYSDRTVINLDGVVNGAALEAIRERRILSYIQGQEIDYLFDWWVTINETYYPFFEPGYQSHLVELYTMPPRTETLYMVAYRVQ